jgi:hypothetical protein
VSVSMGVCGEADPSGVCVWGGGGSQSARFAVGAPTVPRAPAAWSARSPPAVTVTMKREEPPESVEPRSSSSGGSGAASGAASSLEEAQRGGGGRRRACAVMAGMRP